MVNIDDNGNIFMLKIFKVKMIYTKTVFSTKTKLNSNKNYVRRVLFKIFKNNNSILNFNCTT